MARGDYNSYYSFNNRVLNILTRLACSDEGYKPQSSLGAISDLTGQLYVKYKVKQENFILKLQLEI